MFYWMKRHCHSLKPISFILSYVILCFWIYQQNQSALKLAEPSTRNQIECKTNKISQYHPRNLSKVNMNHILKRIQTLAPTRVNPKHVTRILIVATLRSGSSFLGDLLQQTNPLSFYVFEPLYVLKSLRNKERQLPEAMYLLRNLFTCNYQSIPKYNKHILNNPRYLSKNKVLQNLCGRQRKRLIYCGDPQISREMCLRSHVQIIKIVRLTLNKVQKLELLPGTKIVYLQRDPRAIYNSRKEMTWCGTRRCLNITYLCKERADDLRTLKNWTKDPITLVRYEDLALNPIVESRRIFEKLQLDYTTSVQSFVEAHTRDDSKTDNHFSTYRNSSASVFKWKDELTAKEINMIQKSCRYVLEQSGYDFI